MLIPHGPAARLGFSIFVPTHTFAAYLTGGTNGDSLVVLHRRGVTLGATPYYRATLAKYRWLTVFEAGWPARRGRPILRLSLRTLAHRDGVQLTGQARAPALHR